MLLLMRSKCQCLWIPLKCFVITRVVWVLTKCEMAICLYDLLCCGITDFGNTEKIASIWQQQYEYLN